MTGESAPSPLSSSSSSSPSASPPRASTEDRLLDADDVAALLNVPTRWVREATRSGRIPHVRLGRYVRYDRGDVLAWLGEQKSGGAPTTFRKHVPVPRGGTE
jgi:excisionase family DNA binding protein